MAVPAPAPFVVIVIRWWNLRAVVDAGCNSSFVGLHVGGGGSSRRVCLAGATLPGVRINASSYCIAGTLIADWFEMVTGLLVHNS